MDCLKSLIQTHSSFNKNSSFSCSSLHLSGYIAAAVFREARVRKTTFKVAKTDNSAPTSSPDSFDILIIWNMQRNRNMDSGLSYVKIFQKNNTTISYLQVSPVFILFFYFPYFFSFREWIKF